MDNLEFSLTSWNILAPCWITQDWYPSLYHLASNHQKRIYQCEASTTELPRRNDNSCKIFFRSMSGL